MVNSENRTRFVSYRVFPTEAFEKWLKKFKAKDREVLRRINARLMNMTQGCFGHVRSVGAGVSESKIDFGPGYRIYFTIRQNILVILLIGGDKSTQEKDIQEAKRLAENLPDILWFICKMTTKLEKEFDIQNYLQNEETDFNAFYNACIEEDPGDGSLVRRALAEIAKARSMTSLAKQTGLSRQCLYKALLPTSKPSYETIFKIARALQLPTPLPAASWNLLG